MFCASRGFWTEPQLVIWFWFWWVKVWSLHPPSATNTAAVLVVQTKAWKKHQAGRWMSFLLFSFVWFVVGGDTQFLCITSTISQVLQGCGYLPNPDLSVLVACDGWCRIFLFFCSLQVTQFAQHALFPDGLPAKHPVSFTQVHSLFTLRNPSNHPRMQTNTHLSHTRHRNTSRGPLGEI